MIISLSVKIQCRENVLLLTESGWKHICSLLPTASFFLPCLSTTVCSCLLKESGFAKVAWQNGLLAIAVNSDFDKTHNWTQVDKTGFKEGLPVSYLIL